MSRAPSMSATRKMLMWFFRWPKNPYVSFTGSVDFSAAEHYLKSLSVAGESVTINHLVLAAIGRVLVEFPQANARIIGNRIERLQHVGLAMPVNLLGHEGGKNAELGFSLLERVDTLSLVELGRLSQKTVREERGGRTQNAVLRMFMGAIDRLPYPVLAHGLGAFDRILRNPTIARRVYAHVPLSAIVSNVGAAIGPFTGALFRAASFEVPNRLMHIPTIWGISPVQDEVIPVDGKPAVRPMLPVIVVFDHRLFDGIIAGRILNRLAEILCRPAEFFGAGGQMRIGGGARR